MSGSAYGRAVRLLSLCDVFLHHKQRLELFGNIFAPPGLGQFVLKFYAKI